MAKGCIVLHSLVTPLYPIKHWVGMMRGGFDLPPCPGERERETHLTPLIQIKTIGWAWRPAAWTGPHARERERERHLTQ